MVGAHGHRLASPGWKAEKIGGGGFPGKQQGAAAPRPAAGDGGQAPGRGNNRARTTVITPFVGQPGYGPGNPGPARKAPLFGTETIGLLHPDTHFAGNAERFLRARHTNG